MVWEEIVLVKMLMDIDPLSMRGSLVMKMALISPFGKEVSPAEQLRQSPRLLLPRFRLETAVIWPESFLLIFSRSKDIIQQKMGTRGLPGGSQGRGARPGGRARPPPLWLASGPPLVLSSPNIFYIFQKYSPWSFRTFGVVQNRSLIFAPFLVQNSSCRHSPSSCKPYKIREKMHKYCDITCNNSP